MLDKDVFISLSRLQIIKVKLAISSEMEETLLYDIVGIATYNATYPADSYRGTCDIVPGTTPPPQLHPPGK